MLRRLFTILTVLCLLLLGGVLTLWVRSFSHTDTLILRTSPSYTGGPALKWLVVRTDDGLILSSHLKLIPRVAEGSPPWRDDVPVGYLEDVAPWDGGAMLKHPRPPFTGARPMTERERQGYEGRAGANFSASPIFRWQSAPRAGVPPTRQPAGTILNQLGVWGYGPHVFVIDDPLFPGAYRDARVRVSYGFAAAVAAIPPIAWGPFWLRHRRARRRLKSGLCPACGYDLRESAAQCPECGRPIVPGESARARQTPLRFIPSRLRAVGQRRALLTGGVAVAALVAVGIFVNRSDTPSDESHNTFEIRRLRRELDAQFAVISGEVARLRQAGDARGADGLDAELLHFRRRAAGTPPEQSNEPELHFVGVYEGDYPGGKPRPIPLPPLPSGRARPVTPLPPPQGVATVDVTATDRPVVLSLMANNPVKWEVRIAPGARVEKVVLGGYYEQEVIGVPAGVPIVKHNAANPHGVFLFAFRRGGTATGDPAAEALATRITGLPIRTFQARHAATAKPFIVGPGNPAWEIQRILADLRPVHRRAAGFERARALAAVQSLRFLAVWKPSGNATRWGSEQHVAQFDVTGPIRSTLLPLPPVITHAAIDPFGPMWCLTEVGGEGAGLGVLDRAPGMVFSVKPDPSLPKLSGCAGLAYDTRRLRLLMISLNDYGGATGYTYTPHSGKWAVAGDLGRDPRYWSLTFSAHDDCFYAIGGHGVPAITRISPEGKAEWCIPVPAYVGEGMRYDPSRSAQIVAVGRYLAILTPPLPDPLDPAAPPQPRCVLIEPQSNTVQYSGPLAPHDGTPSPSPTSSPASAPSRSPDIRQRRSGD